MRRAGPPLCVDNYSSPSAFRSVMKLNQDILERNTILKGMRRNGMLSYRPDLAAGGLVKSETQAWCKGMKEGSHRLKDHWLVPRYN